MAEALEFEDGGERAIVPADITEALGARLVALGKLDSEGFRTGQFLDVVCALGSFSIDLEAEPTRVILGVAESDGNAYSV